MKIKEAIEFAVDYLSERESASPRLDAELILASVLQRDRAYLHAHPEDRLSCSQERLFHQWLVRRGEHFPLQYLRGRQEFYGREFVVRPGVFIPRPETELLAETALAFLRTQSDTRLQVADIGTGSGCIAITLACEEPRVFISAIDISETALEMARHNAELHGCLDRIEFQWGPTLQPVENRTASFHLIVSNPPYVSFRHEVDPSVRKYEPREAVFAGEGGDEVYRALLEQAKAPLQPGGKLILELGYGARTRLEPLAEKSGWAINEVRKDLSGIDRCAVLEIRQRDG